MSAESKEQSSAGDVPLFMSTERGGGGSHAGEDAQVLSANWCLSLPLGRATNDQGWEGDLVFPWIPFYILIICYFPGYLSIF